MVLSAELFHQASVAKLLGHTAMKLVPVNVASGFLIVKLAVAALTAVVTYSCASA